MARCVEDFSLSRGATGSISIPAVPDAEIEIQLSCILIELQHVSILDRPIGLLCLWRQIVDGCDGIPSTVTTYSDARHLFNCD